MSQRQRWTLRVVCVSTALLLVNVAAPNVALPDIAQDLGASFTDLQWTLSGYALALAVFLLTAGTLADRFGRKRLFLVGLVAFNVASVLCAAAPSAPTLIAARVVQGVGAAIMFPSSLALLAEEFTGPARRRAIGTWGAVIGLSFAAGPLLGGLLVEAAGWRAIFVLNLLLGIPAVWLARLHCASPRTRTRPAPTGPAWWSSAPGCSRSSSRCCAATRWAGEARRSSVAWSPARCSWRCSCSSSTAPRGRCST
jgi:MFS family permease